MTGEPLTPSVAVLLLCRGKPTDRALDGWCPVDEVEWELAELDELTGRLRRPA